MNHRKLAGDPRAIPPETRRGLAWVGWALVGVALLAAVAIFAAPDDDPGPLLLVVLLGTGNAVWFIGPPLGREGKPPFIVLCLVFLGACAGLVLTVAVDLLVAIGVVYLAFVIAILAGARWPPPERAGAIWSLAGTIPACIALVAVIVREIGSDVLTVGLIAGVVIVAARLWTTAFATHTTPR